MTDQPEKMPLTTADLKEYNRIQLQLMIQSAYPSLLEDGAINVSALSDLLSPNTAESGGRFGLSWAGKSESLANIQSLSTASLRPDADNSREFDTSGNVFIEGDNLEVLKTLQKSYFSKVKAIYIDPPYNTGKEFIYPDNFQESLATYLEYSGQVGDDGKRLSTNADTSGRFHSRWLNMMYPRLYLARNLLRDDGVLFVSIDENEARNLIPILIEIFGEENFVSQICVLSNPRGRQSEIIATSHEYILVFAKDLDCLEIEGQGLSDKQLADYKHEDTEGKIYRLRGLRHRGNESRRIDRPDMFFPLFVDPLTKEVSVEKTDRHTETVIPKKSNGVEGRWEWGLETTKARINRLEGVFVSTRGEWDVHQRDYLETGEGEQRRTKWKSLWTEKEVNYQNAKNELKEIFGECPVDYPKPTYLIKKLIEGSTSGDDLILDFFAGSGTTAHAVALANIQDGGSRRFILVQLPEKCAPDSDAGKLGFKSISEICRSRIFRAFDSIIDKNSQELPTTNTDGSDWGMRCFTLSSSSFKGWSGESTKLEAKLDLHVQNVEPSATPEDIVYELLLKAGFPLTTKVTTRDIAGKTVYSVEEGALLICLDKEITPALIDALAEADPLQVICLDEGFKGNDQLKANAVQTFKARAASLETEIVFRTV